jgi:hypothetical protein
MTIRLTEEEKKNIAVKVPEEIQKWSDENNYVIIPEGVKKGLNDGGIIVLAGKEPHSTTAMSTIKNTYSYWYFLADGVLHTVDKCRDDEFCYDNSKLMGSAILHDYFDFLTDDFSIPKEPKARQVEAWKRSYEEILKNFEANNNKAEE